MSPLDDLIPKLNRKTRRAIMFRKNRLFTKKGYRNGVKIKRKRK